MQLALHRNAVAVPEQHPDPGVDIPDPNAEIGIFPRPCNMLLQAAERISVHAAAVIGDLKRERLLMNGRCQCDRALQSILLQSMQECVLNNRLKRKLGHAKI